MAETEGMTFYIEEVEEGDPDPELPPDDGTDGGFNAHDFLNLGDLTESPATAGTTSAPSGHGCNSAHFASVDAAVMSGASPNEAINEQNKFTAPLMGCRVELHGLVARPDLNGGYGVCSSFSSVSGRYSVALDDDRGIFDFKPSNLRLISQGGWLALLRAGDSAAKPPHCDHPSGRGGAAMAVVECPAPVSGAGHGHDHQSSALILIGGADRTGSYSDSNLHFHFCLISFPV